MIKSRLRAMVVGGVLYFGKLLTESVAQKFSL